MEQEETGHMDHVLNHSLNYHGTQGIDMIPACVVIHVPALPVSLTHLLIRSGQEALIWSNVCVCVSSDKREQMISIWAVLVSLEEELYAAPSNLTNFYVLQPET